MLIWDTGEYTILPYHREQKQTDDELSEDSLDGGNEPSTSESEKLHRAFKDVGLTAQLSLTDD